MSSAVFVDRDGVLNAIRQVGEEAASPRVPAEFVMLPRVGEATRRLRAAGMVVVVITNQPVLGRGLMSLEDLDSMHEQLCREAAIDRIEICPHSGHEGCECRKPKPGMLTRSAAALDIDLSKSWTVGDRWVDIAAGSAAGTRTILIEQAYSWSATSSGSPQPDLRPFAFAADLVEAVDLILRLGPTAG